MEKKHTLKRTPAIIGFKMRKAGLFLILLISFFSSYAQQSPKEKCRTLLDSANQAQKQGKFALTIKKLGKVETLVGNKHWPDIRWQIKNLYGVTYYGLSDYGNALGSYREALDIARSTDDAKEKSIATLNNIGQLYIKKKKYKKALWYFKKNYDKVYHPESKHEKFLKKLTGVNIADTYNKTKQYKKAKNILLETQSIKTKKYVMQLWQINYTENIFLQGQIEKALQSALKIYRETLAQPKGVCHLCILDLLSKIYTEKGDFNNAIYYTRQGLHYNRQWKSKVKRYARLASLYGQKGNLATQIKYQDSVIVAKDSLAEQINTQLFQSNKMKFAIQRYKNKLTLSKKRKAANLRLFAVIAIAFLLLVYMLYRWQKNRIVKQRQEKVIAEKKQHLTQLALEKEKNEHALQMEKAHRKQEKLKNKVLRNSRELSAQALFFSKRNDLLQQIIGSLQGLSKTGDGHVELKKYIKELKEHLKTDNEWENFFRHFKEVNGHLVKQLEIDFPSLSASDIRFLCFIYMNLESKEISLIYNITDGAVRKRKQRIAKKMSLPTQDLYTSLLKMT